MNKEWIDETRELASRLYSDISKECGGRMLQLIDEVEKQEQVIAEQRETIIGYKKINNSLRIRLDLLDL